eukprot:GHVT01025721.1.p1 GENE.GHVT01025721.1~~GHVT01025721.1.p1  ORF type:complete len:260 (-),score=19.36 GHVT01025721.1:1103-1882(-)
MEYKGESIHKVECRSSPHQPRQHATAAEPLAHGESQHCERSSYLLTSRNQMEQVDRETTITTRGKQREYRESNKTQRHQQNEAAINRKAKNRSECEDNNSQHQQAKETRREHEAIHQEDEPQGVRKAKKNTPDSWSRNRHTENQTVKGGTFEGGEEETAREIVQEESKERHTRTQNSDYQMTKRQKFPLHVVEANQKSDSNHKTNKSNENLDQLQSNQKQIGTRETEFHDEQPTTFSGNINISNSGKVVEDPRVNAVIR